MILNVPPSQMDMSGSSVQEEEAQSLQHSAFEVLRDMPNPTSDRVQKAQAAKDADPQRLLLQGLLAQLCCAACCCSHVLLLLLLQSTSWMPSHHWTWQRAEDLDRNAWMLTEPAGTAWPVTWRSALPVYCSSQDKVLRAPAVLKAPKSSQCILPYCSVPSIRGHGFNSLPSAQLAWADAAPPLQQRLDGVCAWSLCWQQQ